MIQNRFHYAITGQTAAEIVYHNADHTKEHMGLTPWKNSPNGRVLKSDVSIMPVVRTKHQWPLQMPSSRSGLFK